MLRILFVSACLVASNLAAGAYLTMTSLTTLTPATSKGSSIKFDSIDAIKGFEVSPGKDKVIIKESGVYLIIVSAQVGASSSAASPGYVDVWFSTNGKFVPNSTARTSIENSAATYTLVTEAITKFKAGDVFENFFSASAPSLGCIFIQPDNEPACPSYELVMMKIDET